MVNDYIFNFFQIISTIGGQKTILFLITIVCLILFFYKKDKLLISFILSNYILTLGVVVILKYIVAKPRNPLALVQENSFAFPSGHVAIAFTTFLLIFYLANFVSKSFYKRLLKILATLWLILIILARLYLKVHDMYDIFGSFIIATIIFYILVHLKIFKKYRIQKELTRLSFKTK